MKLKLNPNVIYRVPKFSYATKLAECWDELKTAISHASPDFYQYIKDLDYSQLQQQDSSIRHTVWKYFNRACFRATPYGSFAGLGTAILGRKAADQLQIANQQILHEFPDWSERNLISTDFADIIAGNKKIMANASWYRVQKSLRYLFCLEGKYELAELPEQKMKIEILKICQEPIPILDLINILPDKIDKKSFLELMYIDQLLISELQPNMIGEEYFRRLNFAEKATSPPYIIAERAKIKGEINMGHFRYLPDLIEHLHHLLPTYEAPELVQFIKDFQKKFGEAEIKIMEALDPEIGISYAGLENANLESPLINQLLDPGINRNKNGLPQTHELLLTLMINDSVRVIDLEKMPLPQKIKSIPLPNSVPILCTEADGIVEIGHLGGATANMLTGRFSLAMDSIHGLCKDISQQERQANPEVLFFDIGYKTDSRVDNVSRRRDIYQQQLSILCYDDSEEPIRMNDLYLSVKDGLLVIYSKQHGKRMIPRLASAYNYTLSNLAVFRLLCDLQHQQTHKNLYFRLFDRIPNLDYYPRVQFRNIVVSPESWRLHHSLFNEQSTTAFPGQLLQHLQGRNIANRYLNVTKGDQSLCIDTLNNGDLKELSTMLCRNKSLLVTEAFIPQTASVIDEQHKPYITEYLLWLQHDKTIFSHIRKAISNPSNAEQDRRIIPGQDWLYYEIFCHPLRANQVLFHIVDGVVNPFQNLIKTWFFIHYNENGPHVRFRLQLHRTEDSPRISAAIAELLKEYCRVGVVSDVALRTYNREIERYGMAQINRVEEHFQVDSHYAINLLRLRKNEQELYRGCWFLTVRIIAANLIPEKAFKTALGHTLNAFVNEHCLGPNEFTTLNQAYKEFDNAATNQPLLPEALSEMISNSFIDTLSAYPEAERLSVFGSLFHMHINRLFPTAQRTHETIIYYLMDKCIKKQQYMPAKD